MVVYPSLCFHETNLVICRDGAACLSYWRAGVALSHRPDVAPIAPLGTMIVAWISQSGGGHRPCGGWPLRIFYLSCLGPSSGGLKVPWASKTGHLEGVDYPGKDDDGMLVVPSSVTPRVPHCEQATDFRRDSRRGVIEIQFANLLAEHKKAWQRYADAHGFTLPPDHREVFDGDKIPF